MDKQSDTIEKIQNLIQYSSEDFLVSVTNRGIYNRASKDMEKVLNWNIDLKDDNISVTIDDVCVALNDNFQKSKCTCPSKTTCKHVVMALLYINKYLNTISSSSIKEYEESKKDSSIKDKVIENEISKKDKLSKTEYKELYSELKNISLEELKKLSTKKNYDYALNKIKEHISVVCKEDEMMSFDIPEENVIVYFPKEKSIEMSVCKCKEKNFCRHKTIAILYYLKWSNLIDLKDELEEQGDDTLDEEVVFALLFAKDFILNIFEKGFYACTDKDFDMSSQIATRFAVKNIDNLSKLFRSLSSSIESMLDKRIDLNQITVMNILSKAYNIIIMIIKNKDNKENISKLIEGSREKYIIKRGGEFLGIGSYPWITKSGYAGVTAYFYEKNEKKIYTYTSALPTFYENMENSFENLFRVYNSKNNWDIDISIDNMSKACFKLINYKSNNEMRISSSKTTTVDVYKKTVLDENILKDLDSIIEKDYDNILNKRLSFNYFKGANFNNIVLIPYINIENVTFDKIKQILFFDVVNEDKENITLQLLYSEINKNAFEYIERKCVNKIKDSENKIMTARITKFGNSTIISPISVIEKNGVVNIFFGRLEEGQV